jgi:hypothetical protein
MGRRGGAGLAPGSAVRRYGLLLRTQGAFTNGFGEVVVDTQSPTFDGGGSPKLQALSRELNERLRRLAQRNERDGTLRLLCECGRCSETIEIAADIYEQARSTPLLLIKQGHEDGKPVRSRIGQISLVEAATA